MVDTNSFLITRMPTKVYYMYDVGERLLPLSQNITRSPSYVFANTDTSRSFLAHHQAETKAEPPVPPPSDDRAARDLQPAARVRRQRHCLLTWPAGSRREQRRHGMCSARAVIARLLTQLGCVALQFCVMLGRNEELAADAPGATQIRINLTSSAPIDPRCVHCSLRGGRRR